MILMIVISSDPGLPAFRPSLPRRCILAETSTSSSRKSVAQQAKRKSRGPRPRSWGQGFDGIYSLVISHSHGKWPIEIDGLPISSMVDLSWPC